MAGARSGSAAGVTGNAMSQSSDAAASPHQPVTTDSSAVAIPSIRDITSVDIDELDGDSIEQLQLVLRRLQRRCDDDDDVTEGQMTSACDHQQSTTSGQLTANMHGWNAGRCAK